MLREKLFELYQRKIEILNLKNGILDSMALAMSIRSWEHYKILETQLSEVENLINTIDGLIEAQKLLIGMDDSINELIKEFER